MMMNPHMFSLFLLLFLSSSITAHTSLRVRLTDRALPVVKSFGLHFLEELLNKPFPDFTMFQKLGTECTIRGFTLTSLSMNPNQVDLDFMENSGLRFEIRDLHFTAELRGQVNLCAVLNIRDATTIITGRGVDAIFDVRLYQENGKLKVHMPNCEFRADELNLNTDSRIWQAIDSTLTWFIKNKICPLVQNNAIPKVNSMLENLTMINLNEEYNLSMENLVSADVTVTPRSIDVPFRSAVLWREEADNPLVSGTDLSRLSVITGSDFMAYVAISDSFFKSILESLYRAGPFPVTIPEQNSFWARWGFGQLNIPVGPAEVQFTEPPSLSIRQTGVSVTLKASVQSKVEPQRPPLNVECNAELEFTIRGTKLFPALSRRKPCEVTTGQFIKKAHEGIANPRVNKKIRSLFDEGIPLPLPEGVNFTQSNFLNNNGYMVVGGSLGLDVAIVQRVAQLLTNVM